MPFLFIFFTLGCHCSFKYRPAFCVRIPSFKLYQVFFIQFLNWALEKFIDGDTPLDMVALALAGREGEPTSSLGLMDEDTNPFVLDLLAGGLSSAVLKTCTAPIERIKLQLQAQSELINVGVLDRPYTGIFNCGRRLVQSEGILSMWRGNTVAVLAFFPTKIATFATKEHLKKVFDTPDSASYSTKLAANIAASGLAGAIALCFTYPLNYVRTRLANDNESPKDATRKFMGTVDVFKQTLKSDGILGLYRGFNVFVVGSMVYSGLHFGLYDSVKPIMLSYLESSPGNQALTQSYYFLSFVLGCSVTMCAGIATYPIDTISCRMMMRSGERVKFKSAIHAFCEIFQKDGVRALYGGFLTSVIRGIAGGGILVVLDLLQHLF